MGSVIDHIDELRRQEGAHEPFAPHVDGHQEVPPTLPGFERPGKNTFRSRNQENREDQEAEHGDDGKPLKIHADFHDRLTGTSIAK